MTYVYIDPAWGIEELSYWPETEPIDNRDIGYEGVFSPKNVPAWRLDLCRDGTLSLRRAKEKPFNGVAITVYRHDDEQALRDVQGLMCSRGYPGSEDPRLTHEGGTRYYFSWLTRPLPGTLWQVAAVQRIIHTYISTGDASAAHDEGRRLAAVVEQAANELDLRHRAAR